MANIRGEGSEFHIHTQVVRLIKAHEGRYPLLKYIHHSPNGGHRAWGEGARLNMMGVRPGFPDLFFAGYINQGERIPGFAIEVKSKGGSVSPEQRFWFQYFRTIGYRTLVSSDKFEIWKFIKEHLGIK